MIQIHNKDCLEAMKSMKTDQFDLAIVDPPYGMLEAGMQMGGKKGSSFQRREVNKWDRKPPKEYFDELFRVSKNQIIWGGNYFGLPPTRECICWDKRNCMPSFSRWEMAWTSFKGVMKMYEHISQNPNRIHPTQKPVALYMWLLNTYAKPGDKILDTHIGSGSIAIACHELKYDLEGYEINKTYYQKTMYRLKQHQRQLKLF